MGQIQEEFRVLNEGATADRNRANQLETAMAALQLRFDEQTISMVGTNAKLVECIEKRQSSEQKVQQLNAELLNCTANQITNRQKIEEMEKIINQYNMLTLSKQTSESPRNWHAGTIMIMLLRILWNGSLRNNCWNCFSHCIGH